MSASDSNEPPEGQASPSQSHAKLTTDAKPAETYRAVGGDDASFEFGAATLSAPPGDSNERSSALIGSVDATISMAVEQDPTTPEIDPDGRRVKSGRTLAGLADYELLSEIARGGMGVVYRARQRSLNRIVAVKMILSGQLASDADVQRFRSEAEAAANLQHPNIVAIYEVGETGGRHFFSMQFVDGRSLSDAIREQKISPRFAVECLRTVADAVDYAHSQGILHRDLKPSNILMDAAGTLHLTDFGVAKRLRSDTQFTVTGTILGTPSYMPPEQAAGEKEIGRTADVYSLGAILYELLTGRPPFTAQRPTEILMQVLHNEPVSPRILNPSIPIDLSTVCLKCLEKDASRRYATAHALSADLGRWLVGEPIEARPIGRGERAWRWCKRNPIVAGMTATLMLVIVGAFVGITSQWLVAQSALAQMREAQAQRSAAQVEGLLKAAPESLTLVLDTLKPQYDEIAPELRRLMARRDLADHDRLRLSLALLPGDPAQIDYLRDRMLSIGLAELLAVREAVAPYEDRLRDDLWRALDKGHAKPEERFSAALILARHERDGSQRVTDWQPHAPFLTRRLLDSVTSDPSSYEPLVAALRPIRRTLSPELAKVFRDRAQAESLRAFATSILVNYLAEQPAELAALLVEADTQQFLVIRPRLKNSMPEAIDALVAKIDAAPLAHASDSDKEVAARQRATAAIALLQLGDSQRVWPLLVHTSDPRVRSHLIELFAATKTDPGPLGSRLRDEPDVTARRAILLALGSYQRDALEDQDQRAFLDHAAKLYATDPDAGIHAASEWALRRWGQPTPPPLVDAAQAAESVKPSGWFAGPEGHALAVIDGRAAAAMGSPSTEERRSMAEVGHQMVIGRKFALGTKEVTVEQFRRFIQATGLKMPPFTRKHSPDDNGPMIMVTWYRAAQYCRWLSEQAGLPEDQMCYPPVDQIQDGLQPIEGFLERTGFRLPTEAEWEFASRGGASTSRSFGSGEELLGHYAWYMTNAKDRAWPGGSLKPNDFGLFDMHGNVWEWCGDRWGSYWEHPRGQDVADMTVVNGASNRILRGGSFDSAAKVVRSAFRDRFEKPQFGSDEIGFRIARTLPD
jgi:formylglycine-generating enzyme required for sulfatase activity/tRNA A-37 threonylcarbamoyl transferase component Bud32